MDGGGQDIDPLEGALLGAPDNAFPQFVPRVEDAPDIHTREYVFHDECGPLPQDSDDVAILGGGKQSAIGIRVGAAGRGLRYGRLDHHQEECGSDNQPPRDCDQTRLDRK